MANITENTNINLNLNDTGLSGQIQINMQVNVTSLYSLGASTFLNGAAISNQQTVDGSEPYSSTVQYTASKMVGEGISSLFTITLTSPNQGEPFLHPDSSNNTTYHQSFFSAPYATLAISDEFVGHITGAPVSISSNEIVYAFSCVNMTEEIAENTLTIDMATIFSTGSIYAVQDDGSFGGIISVPDEQTAVNVQVV